jgi:hypothetical protein
MWCKGCRQDVPALPSGDKQTLCCPRCGTPVCADLPKTDGAPATHSFPGYDSWELDEQLLHIQRVLQTRKADGPDSHDDNSTIPVGRREVARFDPPQAGLPARHVAASNRTDKKRKTARRRRHSSGALTWLAIVLGTAGFACGGVLVIWSLTTNRHELWNIGLPVAIVGQIALLVGLVLQIDRLWCDHRAAAAKLGDVDRQLHELKTTTTLLGASQGSASTTFYSHLAGGAGPQLLLTDLKSQLDLLATKIAQEQ